MYDSIYGADSGVGLGVGDVGYILLMLFYLANPTASFGGDYEPGVFDVTLSAVPLISFIISMATVFLDFLLAYLNLFMSSWSPSPSSPSYMPSLVTTDFIFTIVFC